MFFSELLMTKSKFTNNVLNKKVPKNLSLEQSKVHKIHIMNIHTHYKN